VSARQQGISALCQLHVRLCDSSHKVHAHFI
jgi:hypothetical protein